MGEPLHAMALDTARVVELALAASPAPLSIDTLVGWNLTRPAEVWRALSAARAGGRLAEPEPGHFAFVEPADRDATIAAAGPLAWAALLATPDRIGWAMSAARAAAGERRFEAAEEILRALVAVRPREAFPGGARGWLGVVLETLRQSRAMYLLAPAQLEEARATAVAHGELAAQGVLEGALAAAALREGRTEDARRHLSHARQAAFACSGRARAEIQLYLAVGLTLQGRLRQAIETFEELLGDVPDEELETLLEPASPSPAASVQVVVVAYCAAGQVPRALDLLERLRAVAVARDLPALAHEVDLFTALAHQTRDDHDAARLHAERAHAYYAARRTDPIHLWFSATALASARAWEGRLDEIPALLEVGLAARARASWPWLAATGVLSLLELLDLEGRRVEGISLESEIERLLGSPSTFWVGVAHRYRARQLARAPAGELDPRAVRDHLDRAIAHLREAGAGHELARALADAAGLARGGGRDEDARRLGAELRALPAMGAATAPPSDASARLTGILLELGRLGTLAARREGTWGEIASRLCRGVAAERCAIVEAGDPPRLLGVRGGSGAWREAILALARTRAPRAVEVLPAPDAPGEAAGQLLVVPFAAEGRAGWAFLESRYGAPVTGPDDGAILEVISVQLGILLGNVALSQALASARERLEEENRYWRSTGPAAAPGSRIVGDSPALRAVLDLVARVAPATTPVLITGETGVGKELVAAEIHRQGPRRAGPFIAVHVASLSPGLVASGLFGHERGAFTGATEQAKGRFELADGGTLFLDEIGELSGEDQVRLLRVLQEGTFERVGGTRPLRSDFRLVAATNRDLAAEVRAGRFREDLYYRLAGVPIRVPPLRERLEEIPTLALYFLERATRARGVRFEGITEADVRRMLDYGWPGNVRELEHVIERAVLLSEPPRLRIPPLEAAIRPGPATDPAERREWPTLEGLERRYVAEVLRRVRGRVTGAGGAAEILGVKPSTLNFRIRKLGLADELRRARGRPRRA